MTRTKLGEQVEAIVDARACLQRTRGGCLDHRSIRDGIGEWNADLNHVRAASYDHIEQSLAGVQVRVSKHEERSERALSTLLQPLEHCSVAADSIAPSSACACATSLSPRPDRLTT